GQHRIRDSLAHLYPDQILDSVIQTLQMLNVQRRDDMNAGGEDVLYVLISLCISAARRVRVCQLIDEHDLRMALDDRIGIHLFDHDPAIFDLPPRHELQTLDELRRLGAAMGFNKADHDIDAILLESLALHQHLIRLADAGAIAEIELEPPALRAADH